VISAAQKDGEAAACPSGYTPRSTSYYLDADDEVSCSFECSGTDGQCNTPSALQNGCTGGVQPTLGCEASDNNSFANITVMPSTAGGTCNTVDVVTNGTSAPTDPKTVCCEG
jgi:hypothetical protein